MWRLTRALMNKREKTPEGGSSYEVEHPETPRDQHVSQGNGYLEPLEVMPPAISHYQSLHKNGTSAKYDNVVSNSGTDNDEEDELYLTIIPWVQIGWEIYNRPVSRKEERKNCLIKLFDPLHNVDIFS